MKFSDHHEIVIVPDEIDGVKDWTWTRFDSAFGDIGRDWLSEHKANIQKHVKNFNVVFQAGGNQGMYPRLMSQMFKVVYTFEPDPLNFYCLNQNCQSENIIKFNCALGDDHKCLLVERATMNNTGMHKVVNERPGIVPVLRIDDFRPAALDLIYLDVEGYEMNVLAGAFENISGFKPVIFAENGRSDTIQNYLSGLGYELVGQSVSDAIYVPK